MPYIIIAFGLKVAVQDSRQTDEGKRLLHESAPFLDTPMICMLNETSHN
jgi:hypothetical protein